MAILFRALSDVGIKPQEKSFFKVVRGRPTILEFAVETTTPPMLDFTIICTAGSLSYVTGANPDSAI